jgi:hypothetical protein
MSEETIPGVHLSMKGKAIVTIVIMVLALGLAVNSSIKYEASNNTAPTTISHPPPTYTGSAPLAITSTQDALDSNNDFILVFTPSADEALNASVLNSITTAAANIRKADGIYVGVFTMPKSDSLTYPTVLTRLLNKGTAAVYQYTFRKDVTVDAIFNQYLNWKFLR